MIFAIIGIVVLIIIAIVLSGCKSNPDPHFHKWQLVDTTTERWKNYCDYMKKITSDTLLALEMQKKVLVDGVWKRFYQWVSDWDLFNVLDYWDLPDEVFERGTCDCDGFAFINPERVKLVVIDREGNLFIKGEVKKLN